MKNEAAGLPRMRRTNRCRDCEACAALGPCAPSNQGDRAKMDENCIGCGACALLCPNEAVELKAVEAATPIKAEVDGVEVELPGGTTIASALRYLGHDVGSQPSSAVFTPCQSGGCWSCAVQVEGESARACVTAVREGIKLSTATEGRPPLRIMQSFKGHGVGGVGTPWEVKQVAGYIEVACFAAGCNFRCPQCQNWTITYCGSEPPITPREAATRLTEARRHYGVDRMAISGGESTLNRPWLTACLRELKRLNPDREARLHVDTNGSLLTPDYLDELVEAGMTDVGIDLKAWSVGTFRKITGLQDPGLAQLYMDTAWRAVRHVVANHPAIFLGVGLVANRALVSTSELEQTGRALASIEPGLQVTVLDYRPEFRARRLKRPSVREMMRARETLMGVGLERIICQTSRGHLGP